MGNLCNCNECDHLVDRDSFLDSSIIASQHQNKQPLSKQEQLTNKYNQNENVIEEENTYVSKDNTLHPSFMHTNNRMTLPKHYSQGQTSALRQTGSANDLNIGQQSIKLNEQNLIKDGDIIYIFNHKSKRKLHSHAIKYEKGSKQYEVTTCTGKGKTCDTYDQWQINKVSNLSFSEEVEYFQDGDSVQIKHVITDKYLSSQSNYIFPDNKNQQIFCAQTNDDFTHWILKFESSATGSENTFNKKLSSDNQKTQSQSTNIIFLMNNQKVQLIHQNSLGNLHAENQEKATMNDQKQVICCYKSDEEDVWSIQKHK